jgi:hypothetical protein
MLRKIYNNPEPRSIQLHFAAVNVSSPQAMSMLDVASGLKERGSMLCMDLQYAGQAKSHLIAARLQSAPSLALADVIQQPRFLILALLCSSLSVPP